MRTLITILLFAGIAVACSAEGPITLVANGRTIASDPAPLLHDGHVYVPLRAAAEAIGGEVKYDAANKRVQICRGDFCTFMMQSEGLTVNGRLLIGIRQVAEALNARVNWDAEGRRVLITTLD